MPVVGVYKGRSHYYCTLTMNSSLLLVLCLLVLLGCAQSVAIDPVTILTDETNEESELSCNVFLCMHMHVALKQSCLAGEVPLLV